jgi:hypothetical protein
MPVGAYGSGAGGVSIWQGGDVAVVMQCDDEVVARIEGVLAAGGVGKLSLARPLDAWDDAVTGELVLVVADGGATGAALRWICRAEPMRRLTLQRPVVLDKFKAVEPLVPLTWLEPSLAVDDRDALYEEAYLRDDVEDRLLAGVIEMRPYLRDEMAELRAAPEVPADGEQDETLGQQKDATTLLFRMAGMDPDVLGGWQPDEPGRPYLAGVADENSLIEYDANNFMMPVSSKP